MNEENVMRMPGSSEAQRSRIRDEETFISGAPLLVLAYPVHGCTAIAASRCNTAAAPDAFDGAAEINPKPEENS
jgi:hypothetical protein